MEDYSLEVRGEVQQIFKVLSKDDQDKMPFEGIQIAKTLGRVPFFKRFFDTNSEHFINLCIAQTVVEYQTGTDVYKIETQEGRSRYLYVLLDGSVEVSSPITKSRKMGILRIFGQLEIVFQLSKRQEKVACLQKCKFMRISQTNLLKIITCMNSMKKCLHFLNVNPYFQKLNQLQKMQLSLFLTKKSFSKGQIIKAQGETLQNIMFFIYGKAQVISKLPIQKQEEYVIDQLEEMSSFGQYECFASAATELKVRGAITGGYYSLNYPQTLIEQHRIIQLMQEQAYPYPSTQNLVFLNNVKQTLRKEEKRVMKQLF